MTEAEQRALDVAVLMAQELQEFVDDAIEAEDNPNALAATQELLKEWEAAYEAAGGRGWMQRMVDAPGESATLKIFDEAPQLKE